MDKVKACDCNLPIMFSYTTSILFIPVRHTIICINCRKKVSAFTFERALEKWNKLHDK